VPLQHAAAQVENASKRILIAQRCNHRHFQDRI
jgi:hypothetical protein